MPQSPSMEGLLRQAAQILSSFAQGHCGPASQVTRRTEGGFLGIGSRRVVTEEQCWAVSIENTYEARPDGKFYEVACAILDLQQTPAAIIRVAPNDQGLYFVQIMVEMRL